MVNGKFSKDGEFIREYHSITEAHLDLKINFGRISTVCRSNVDRILGISTRLGGCFSAGNFIWKWKDPEKAMNYYRHKHKQKDS